MDDKAFVERIAHYIESESDCLMAIVVGETKHQYGVRLLKVMAQELRDEFARGTFDRVLCVCTHPRIKHRNEDGGEMAGSGCLWCDCPEYKES